VPDGLFAWGLTVAAELSANPGDARRSTAWAEEAVALFRRVGDDIGLAHALAALGSAYANQARLDEADAVLAEAIELGEQQQDALLLARLLNFLSFVATRRGDHQAAAGINRDELERWRQLGSRRGQATALRHLAVAQWYGGALDDAEALCNEALALWEAVDDPVSIAHVQTTLADIQRVRGDLAAARCLYEAALAELRSVADRRCTASTLKNLGLISLAEDDDGTARSQFRQALLLRHELGDTAGLAECLEGLALVHARDPVPAQQERTMELLCVAAALRRSCGTPAPPWESQVLDEALAAADTALAPDRRAAAEAAAAAMTADSIVAAYG
jgi:tetratricopeptide (TPR) repeat protein